MWDAVSFFDDRGARAISTEKRMCLMSSLCNLSTCVDVSVVQQIWDKKQINKGRFDRVNCKLLSASWAPEVKLFCLNLMFFHLETISNPMLLYQMHLHKIPVNLFFFFWRSRRRGNMQWYKVKLSQQNLEAYCWLPQKKYLDLSVIFFKTKTKKYWWGNRSERDPFFLFKSRNLKIILL